MNGEIPCFITTIQLEEDGTIVDSRCVGYYLNMYQAQACVKDNCCDIHETCYNYVVIEAFPPGLYRQSIWEIWYKWDAQERKYVLSVKPKVLERTVNFGLG